MCKVLSSNDKGITTAAEELLNSNVVIFPTETVLGIGANANDKVAIEKIFKYKMRPKNNPLIIHSLDWNIAKIYTNLSKIELDIVEKIKHFWPGPLTILVRSSSYVLSEVNNNSGMVGIRIPSNHIARALLKKSGLSIVAPSANISGKFSSTCFDHAKSYFEKNSDINIIKYDQNCQYGIESTIVKIIDDEVTLVRPGIILKEEIEKVIGKSIMVQNPNCQLDHPGSSISHYQTSKDSKLVNFLVDDFGLSEYHIEFESAVSTYLSNSIFIDFGGKNNDKIDLFYAYVDLSEQGDQKEALYNLYNVLYQIDNIDNCNNLLIFNFFKDKSGLSSILYDRLYRCCSGREIVIPLI